MILRIPEVARSAKPGQFLTLRISKHYPPFLRRPFSIYRIVKPDLVQILYDVVGKGTQLLSQKKTGEYIDALGPLGNGFDLSLPCRLASRRSPLGARLSAKPREAEGSRGKPSEAEGSRGRAGATTEGSAILVGGGVGIAPLFFLAEKLIISGQDKITVLIGARTKKEIISKKEFQALGCDVRISTDDGSLGFKGRVTDLLKCQLSAIPALPARLAALASRRSPLGEAEGSRGKPRAGRSYQLSAIYACGPKPMLKQIVATCKRRNIRAQVSLDEYMACGLGVCLGCVVKTKQGLKRVCHDGPVFEARLLNL